MYASQNATIGLSLKRHRGDLGDLRGQRLYEVGLWRANPGHLLFLEVGPWGRGNSRGRLQANELAKPRIKAVFGRAPSHGHP